MGIRETGRQGSGEDYIARSLMICTSRQISSGYQIEKNEMDRQVACMEDMKGAYRVLVGRHKGKGPLGRPRSKWK